MACFYTTLGDDGTTNLLGAERVPKYHPQPEALGSVDEVSAAMGLARALVHSDRSRQALLECQRCLYRLMTELATTPQTADQFPGVRLDDVAWLEQQADELGAELNLPRDFIVPGDSLPGAALDVARAVARRAERQVARLLHDQLIGNRQTLRYLNRLSSFLFVLARYEDALSGVSQVTLAKPIP